MIQVPLILEIRIVILAINDLIAHFTFSLIDHIKAPSTTHRWLLLFHYVSRALLLVWQHPLQRPCLYQYGRVSLALRVITVELQGCEEFIIDMCGFDVILILELVAKFWLEEATLGSNRIKLIFHLLI